MSQRLLHRICEDVGAYIYREKATADLSNSFQVMFLQLSPESHHSGIIFFYFLKESQLCFPVREWEQLGYSNLSMGDRL
jgi:hypothetical protein